LLANHIPVKQTFDAIVLGAGAAGLMCAIEAGKRGRRVCLHDHAPRIGKKILISGGGRCNFTNLHCGPENFISANPHFAKSALARYTPADFIALVEKHSIAYHEKTLGQLFCDGSAQQILAMLEEECRRAGVRIVTGTEIREVSRPEHFVVRTDADELHAPVLVVATGGLSIPKIGATAYGYDLARQFGLHVQPCRPALVPLLFDASDRKRWCELAGVSLAVTASIGHVRFTEKMLITHHGLSGPAILQLSSFWRKPEAVVIDLAPSKEVITPMLAQSGGRDAASVRAALRQALPARFADRWLEANSPENWSNHSLAELERRLHHWEIIPSDTEGYEKAEVTAGGVDTGELSAKTMESRKVPGLYFIGEVVDVTGQLGGFNFQWAWSSGFCAGQAV
jgi:predicted Rossmann fold flavoprotein